MNRTLLVASLLFLVLAVDLLTILLPPPAWVVHALLYATAALLALAGLVWRLERKAIAEHRRAAFAGLAKGAAESRAGTRSSTGRLRPGVSPPRP